MDLKNKLFFSIFISFLVLLFSLYISYSNTSKNNDIIKQIEKNQIKLSFLSNKLNYDIKINQTEILQQIILDKDQDIFKLNASMKNINKTISRLNKFSKKVHLKEFSDVILTIKKRIIAYTLVKNSLLASIKSKDEEDIHDSIIGFNLITISFSQDIERLIDIANTELYATVLELQNRNEETSKTTLLSFVIALILILTSLYKIITLNKKIAIELKRAEEAETIQKKLQEQLLKYNEDLELEITKKTKELKTKMYTHFLSGLPNRNKLLEDAELYNFKQMALLNIDKFQKFNDVYGEEIGNIALKLSAEFLQNQVDDENILIYHIGGDEFVFAVKDTQVVNDELFSKKIEKILSSYSKESFLYEDKTFHFVMSAGIAFSGRKKMLAYADMALKDAKARNIQLSVFNDKQGLQKIHQDDIDCHKKLLRAFETDSVISYFQPIVPIQDSNKPIKYESLVRIKEEDGNILPPFNFIKVARQNRIYYKLTNQVVKNTLEVIQKYKIPCSLNISIVDIENSKTLDMLYETFRKFRYNHLLTVELLETEEFKDYQAVHDFCLKVRSFGIKIALDDFGSGYSNFTHILNLPIGYIKIDASLISNIDRDIHAQIMVETIVGLAKKLNIETIAEFVSSQEILNIVKKLDVDYAQGYYTGKPESIETHLPY
ncbi:EAL domain-containing protein [Sulfurimonas sp.]